MLYTIHEYKYILHRPDEKHDTHCNNNLIKPDVFHLKFTYVLCRMSFYKILDQNSDVLNNQMTTSKIIEKALLNNLLK